MTDKEQSEYQTVEAEVIDSTVVDENRLKKVLLRAGKAIAQPALEAFELIVDPSTPPQARVTMVAALTYLLMPMDLIPDFTPGAGFSDDLVALTAVIGIWNSHITPEIRSRVKRKLDKLFPL